MAAVEPPRRSPVPFIVVGLLIAAGLCTLATVASGAIGVFTALLFLPMPPMPAGLTLTVHSSETYGRDVWHYTAARPPCAVLADYVAQNAACTVEPGVCDGYDTPVPDSFYNDETGILAVCTGEQAFSAFGQTWRAAIFRAQTPENARVRISRQVQWGGSRSSSTREPAATGP